MIARPCAAPIAGTCGSVRSVCSESTRTAAATAGIASSGSADEPRRAISLSRGRLAYLSLNKTGKKRGRSILPPIVIAPSSVNNQQPSQFSNWSEDWFLKVSRKAFHGTTKPLIAIISGAARSASCVPGRALSLGGKKGRETTSTVKR